MPVSSDSPKPQKMSDKPYAGFYIVPESGCLWHLIYLYLHQESATAVNNLWTAFFLPSLDLHLGCLNCLHLQYSHPTTFILNRQLQCMYDTEGNSKLGGSGSKSSTITYLLVIGLMSHLLWTSDSSSIKLECLHQVHGQCSVMMNFFFLHNCPTPVHLPKLLNQLMFIKFAMK